MLQRSQVRKLQLPQYTVVQSQVQILEDKPQIPHGILASSFPRAWQDGLTGKDIVVAVLDTGIDQNHPDLQGKVIATYNYTGEAITENHGTHVAGTIAAKGRMLGGAYDAKLIDIKILGREGGNINNVVKGILQASQDGAQIINLSLGAQNITEAERQAVTSAVQTAWNRGSICIAAAGNSGTSLCSIDPYEYPASVDRAESIGACLVSPDLQTITLAPFSEENDKVDLAACGVDILSTVRGNGYATYRGTSMASPHVSAMAAVLAQKFRQQYPNVRGSTFSANVVSLLRANVICLAACLAPKTITKETVTKPMIRPYLDKSWVTASLLETRQPEPILLPCPHQASNVNPLNAVQASVVCPNISFGYGFVRYRPDLPPIRP